MAKLEESIKRRRTSGSDRRFYTSLDMALIKQETAILNARINRGEVEDHKHTIIVPCGCGVEGCFIHTHVDAVSK